MFPAFHVFDVCVCDDDDRFKGLFVQSTSDFKDY